MKVLKFGGTSVGTPERIAELSSLIVKRHKAGDKLTIIFSAFGGVTDLLIRAANEAADANEAYAVTSAKLRQRHLVAIESLGLSESKVKEEIENNFDVLEDLLKGVFLVREASLRTMDYILSFGERNSAPIIAAYLQSLGIPAQYLDARLIIKTNKEFGRAKVNFELTEPLIKEYFEEHAKKMHIVTGFVATDIGGLTTTLGRGGSDYTAAILAGALDAEVLEIWTDVDGVLTSNPKVVKNAYTIPELSYDEAMELSHFGAKVIYPPTIQPALSKSIPIYIKNTFNPEFIGTLISGEVNTSSKKKITGVTSISDIALLTLEGSGLMGNHGIAARMFSALATHKINIVMITQASSEHSICIAVMSDNSQGAIDVINEEFKKERESFLIKPIKCEDHLSLVAVVGEKMKSVPGVAGSLFKALGRNGINVIAIAQGSSELNISFAIKKKDEVKALNLVHDAFFLSDSKGLNLFLMGVGLIGKTLLDQIKDQYQSLLTDKNLDIRVIGMANSKKMYFDSDGVDLQNWNNLLENGEQSSFAGFIDQMCSYNYANSIFIDCTANHNIIDHYERILENNISISTANKVAASANYEFYKNLHEKAIRYNVQFLYETNVGAGLPVLSTLEGLVRSGDKVEQIHAVISGSLSYIFNNYSPEKSFKELILQAREKGYTEPDPRDDLSGMDIKRKIVILSRVAGYEIEAKDVSVEALLPESCMEAESIDEFFVELDRHDKHFRALIEEAHTKNAKLRYLATLIDGKAAIELKMVTEESPFYNLASTDNMVVFWTMRYKERPLVVQGPGAGASVTAAGVFAEIIQLGNSVE
ncbi:MAG: aspartokinase/homoserine dehydrogenase 1 [Saprospiraceae bacterium]|jgi:aspartokinase/homoserine dehydrogenase 1